MGTTVDNKEEKDEAWASLPCAIPSSRDVVKVEEETEKASDEERDPPLVEATAVEVVAPCPLGYWTTLALTLGYLAALCSVASIFACYVVGDPYILFGYTCLRFVPASSYSHEDVFFRYGRIASTVGGVGGLAYTGVVTALWSCSGGCCGNHNKTAVGVSPKSLALVASGFGALSLVSFSALVARVTDACSHVHASLGPSQCKFGNGMGLSAAAGVLFLLATGITWVWGRQKVQNQFAGFN